MSQTRKQLLIDPLVDNNPITLQVLGICSALAVTSSLNVAFVMSLAVIAVTGFSSLFISMPSELHPKFNSDYCTNGNNSFTGNTCGSDIKAFAYDNHKTLSVFVGLIITNCIVMGRAEAFAMKNTPVDSFIDGVGNGLGYGLLLMCVGVFRELFGSGSLFGIMILNPINNGGWYVPNGFLLLPPSAFFIIGFLIWGIRTWKKTQVEAREYKIQSQEVH